MRVTLFAKFLSSLMLILCIGVYAQVPRTLSYQGVLTDSLGNPNPDGLYSLTFRLYDVSNGGSALWTETKSIQVNRGLFSTILGDQTPIGNSLTFNKPYWLSLQISSESELSPRLPLTAVGYSIYSTKSDTAIFALNNPSGWTASTDIVRLSKLSDKVGIGLTDPSTKLEVNDLMRVSNIFSWPTKGSGLELAYNPGMRRGYIQVYDRDSSKWGELYLGDVKIGVGAFSSDKFTVNGTIRSLTGGFVFPDGSIQTSAVTTSSGISLPYLGSATTTGNVFSITNLGNGTGIYGKHNSSNNFGYLGSLDYGVYGESSKDGIGPVNPAGAGVYGKHTSAGYGVYGISLNGTGVSGFSTNAYGVLGRTSTDGSAGVFGIKGSNYGQLGTGLEGVYGESASNTGSGVAGVNSGSGQGVYGVNSSSGQSGQLGGTNYGVRAEGDLIVTGAYKGDIGPNLGAPFPRPAFDSQFESLMPGEEKTIVHNLNFPEYNYVVDFQILYDGGTISNINGPNAADANWFDLTKNTIKIKRALTALTVIAARVRIWVYK